MAVGLVVLPAVRAAVAVVAAVDGHVIAGADCNTLGRSVSSAQFMKVLWLTFLTEAVACESKQASVVNVAMRDIAVVVFDRFVCLFCSSDLLIKFNHSGGKSNQFMCTTAMIRPPS